MIEFDDTSVRFWTDSELSDADDNLRSYPFEECLSWNANSSLNAVSQLRVYKAFARDAFDLIQALVEPLPSLTSTRDPTEPTRRARLLAEKWKLRRADLIS